MAVFDPVIELKAKFSNVTLSAGEEATAAVYECSPGEVLEVYKIEFEPPVSSDGTRLLSFRDVGLMVNGEKYPYVHINSVMMPKEEPELGFKSVKLGIPLLHSRLSGYTPSALECTTIKLKEGDKLQVYAIPDEAVTSASFTVTLRAARVRGAEALIREAGSMYDASFTLDNDVYSKPPIVITPSTFNELPGGIAQSKPAVYPWITYAKNAVGTTPNVWYDFDYPNYVAREWQDLSFNLVDKSKAYLIRYLGVIPHANSLKTRIYVEGRETNPDFETAVNENFFLPARPYTTRPVAAGRTITLSVAAGGSSLVPAGVWFVFCSTNGKIQVFNGSSWVDLTTTAGKACIASDGTNVRIYNGGTGAESQTLVGVEHYDIKRMEPTELFPPRLLHGVKGGIQHLDNGSTIPANGVEIHVYGAICILK